VKLELIRQDALADIRAIGEQALKKILPSEDALAIRDELLANVRTACHQVTTPKEQLSAVNYAKELKAWIAGAEDFQDTINKVILPIQRKSRAMTDAACEPVIKLQTELKAMLTQFTIEEQKRVAREEAERQAKIRAAQAETDRLNREAQERQRKIETDRLEAERLQRLATEQAAAAKNKKQREAAAEAQRLADEAAKNQASQEDLETAAQAEMAAYAAEQDERAAILAPAPEVSRQAGQVTRKVKRWKLQDDSEAIHRLYAANRALVRMEPNAAAIQAICFPENSTPGIDVTWERETQIRGT
jgi:hypothetical protein